MGDLADVIIGNPDTTTRVPELRNGVVTQTSPLLVRVGAATTATPCSTLGSYTPTVGDVIGGARARRGSPRARPMLGAGGTGGGGTPEVAISSNDPWALIRCGSTPNIGHVVRPCRRACGIVARSAHRAPRARRARPDLPAQRRRCPGHQARPDPPEPDQAPDRPAGPAGPAGGCR